MSDTTHEEQVPVNPTTTEDAKPAESARDRIRTAILSGAKAKVKVIKVFGENVEFRQPTLRQIINLQVNEHREEAVIDALIQYCYAPGTNEHIFGEVDRDALLDMPFGDDLMAINQALLDLTGIKIEEAEKNSSEIQPSERSS